MIVSSYAILKPSTRKALSKYMFIFFLMLKKKKKNSETISCFKIQIFRVLRLGVAFLLFLKECFSEVA